MWEKLLGSGVFARGSNPLTKTILGVSLIYGQFRAMAVVKGHIAGSWVFPGLVHTADDLRTALQEAIRATNFPGQLVSFLVEDTRLMHNYHLVPQMKQADLDQFLERIAIQEKATEGPVVWRYRRAHQAKERIGLLLDIWPQSLVNEFISVCEDLSLRPVHLLPLSAVFVDQVRMLATSTKKVLLLVTQMAGKVVFVVATGDGKPLFDRFLSSTKDEVLDPERIGREIIRSVLFAQQQLRKQITQVWVMGETEELSAERLQPFVELPILPSPMKPDLLLDLGWGDAPCHPFLELYSVGSSDGADSKGDVKVRGGNGRGIGMCVYHDGWSDRRTAGSRARYKLGPFARNPGLGSGKEGLESSLPDLGGQASLGKGRHGRRAFAGHRMVPGISSRYSSPRGDADQGLAGRPRARLGPRAPRRGFQRSQAERQGAGGV